MKTTWLSSRPTGSWSDCSTNANVWRRACDDQRKEFWEAAMSVERCYGFVCFFPLDSSGQKFFGFSEFLAALALMVLAWTTADVRYKFRVRTAPIPLQGITYSVVAAVGLLTLLTDLWRAEQWLVPRGNLLTPGAWQALLGFVFLFTFLLWAWFAFIGPPTYGRLNARRYARALYRVVLQGSQADLAVVADELAYSIRSVLRHASDSATIERSKGNDGQPTRKLAAVEDYANQLILLIADRRLCRAIIASSPATALALFQQLADSQKHVVNIRPFVGNIVTEAILNKDSFLYHEVEGYDTGLMGYAKPLSQAMFSNCRLVLAMEHMLDPDYPLSERWDTAQWQAYARVALMTVGSFIEDGNVHHEPVFARVMETMKSLASRIYEVDGKTNLDYRDGPLARLAIAVDFVKDVVKLLDKKGALAHVKLRERDERFRFSGTIFDGLARLVAEIVYHASAVKSPRWTCWTVQHNSVWGEFFSLSMIGPAARIVQHKARRLIYDDIVEMEQFPNFKSARILGMCLNVMGWHPDVGSFREESRALKKVVVAWTKRNYKWLYQLNPHIAEECLVEEIVYDPKLNRLLKTWPQHLNRRPRITYLQLLSVPRPTAQARGLNARAGQQSS